MSDTLDFNTKYGKIMLTAATDSSFPDVDIREELNSVNIDDDPYNTYGLATKWLVTSSVAAHDASPKAHEELFNSFISKLYELYESQGELYVNTISDREYGNKIFANRKVVVNGDTEHPKFLVCSNKRDEDYDDLVRRVEALEAALAQHG